MRFDIVVSNFNRGEIFWRSFDALVGFDPAVDRLIIMDSSANPTAEAAKTREAVQKYNLGSSVLFFKRRNWCMNHGAHLDYIRLLSDGIIEAPKYSFLIQDHYLNRFEAIKNDTLPDGVVLRLGDAERILANGGRKVLFCARNGYRITATVPSALLLKGRLDDLRHYAGSRDISFCIDGGNLCVDPRYYIEFFRRNPRLFVAGDGTYQFTYVWETRLAKILYDAGFSFHELSRDIAYTTVAALKADFPDPGSAWRYFYTDYQSYILYGKDIVKYPLRPRRVANTISKYIRRQIKLDRDTTIRQVALR